MGKIFWRLFGLNEMVDRHLSLSALDIGVDVVCGNQLPGDYFEFGVFRGHSFCYVYDRFLRQEGKDANFPSRRFVAFDSFLGLPDSDEAHRPTQYEPGAYSATENSFRRRCRKAKIPDESLVVVSGSFSKTLTGDSPATNLDRKVAMIYIDVDLEISAEPVFEFITSYLQTGTVIVIDDWFRHRGVPEYGVQRAFYDWQTRNPHIRLVPLHQWRRVAFIVQVVTDHKEFENE